jgi:hypothetical protein
LLFASYSTLIVRERNLKRGVSVGIEGEKREQGEGVAHTLRVTMLCCACARGGVDCTKVWSTQFIERR